jgi:DNA-binding PadR family transcriptional regulator
LLLTEGENHGGFIISALKERLCNFSCDSAGVYRTLNQLESEGAVTANWDTSQAGPAKKIYKITDIGYEKLELFKEDIEARITNLNYFLNQYKTIKK